MRYYAKHNGLEFISSENKAQFYKSLTKRMNHMMKTQDSNLSFSVFYEEDGKHYHKTNTWLSSGDGQAHTREFHPPKEITDEK